MECLDVSSMEATVMLKVCQLCTVDFTLKHFLLPLIDGMVKRGWVVTSVCSDGPNVNTLREKGYVIDTVPLLRSANPVAALRAFVALVSYFKKNRFDIVHVHTPVAALIGRLAAAVAGVPLVVYTAHGFYFHDDMPKWKYSLVLGLERMAGRFTDLLFTQSQEDAETAIRENLLPKKQILPIGNGVDIARFDPLKVSLSADVRLAFGIPQDVFVIGMVGRLVREKGLEEFLQATQILGEKYSDVWVLLVGEKLDSDHAEGAQNSLERAKRLLGKRFVATGLRDDIPSLLQAMDVFCLPSWREGMPRSIIEAMMMSKPVVATDIRGSREEVVDGISGFLVPVRSVDELAERIERLYLEPALRDKFGEEGRRRALALYDESKIVSLQVDRIAAELLR